MEKVAVVGVGETRFTGPQTKTEVELFAEAATEALTESNLKPKDIKALFIGNALGDFEEGQGMIQSYIAENIGCLYVPANRYEGACASASMAVRDAWMWVASGYYDIVLARGWNGRRRWAPAWRQGLSPCSAMPVTSILPASLFRRSSPC